MRFDNPIDNQVLAFLRNFIIKFNISVPQGLTSAAIPVKQPDTNYTILAMPSWNTTLWITAKSTSQFTGNFGTGAPANAKIDYMIIRDD